MSSDLVVAMTTPKNSNFSSDLLGQPDPALHGQVGVTMKSLSDLNDEKAMTLIPAMAFFGLLMIAGLVGNSLVVYAFCVKLRSGTQNRLIVVLAVFDLMSCAITIPNDIVDLRFFFTFQSQVACKTIRFISMFCGIGSILTLLVIAVDRFRKICRPLKRQMHGREVKLSMVAITVGAFFFSWPSAIVHGLRTATTQVPGLYGQDCSTPNALGNTIWPLVYNAILFMCFLVITVALIVLYYLILNKTRKHMRYMNRSKAPNCSGSSHSCDESSGEPKRDNGDKVTLNSTLSTSTVNDNNNNDYEISPSPSSLITPMSSMSPCTGRLKHPRHELEIPALKILGSKPVCDVTESRGHQKRFICEGNSQTQEARSYSQQSTNSNREYQNNLDLLVPKEKPEVGSESIDPDLSEMVQPELNIETGDSERAKVRFSNFLDCENCEKSPCTDSSAEQDNSKVEPEVARRTPEKAKVGRTRLRSKTTTIAFWITLVFILSFLPYLSLTVLKLLIQGFDYSLDGAALVLFNIALRSYFINAVSNPLIYGVMNVKFRGEVKRLIKRIFRWH